MCITERASIRQSENEPKFLAIYWVGMSTEHYRNGDVLAVEPIDAKLSSAYALCSKASAKVPWNIASWKKCQTVIITM